MTRAVVLDFDGTLITFDRTAAYRAALAAVGVRRAGLAERLSARDRARSLAGRYSRAELLARAVPGLGEADTRRAEDAFFREIAATTRPAPGALALLDHCRQARLALGLLTDWDGAPGRKAARLAASGLLDRFDAVVIAGETVPELKPAAPPFEACLARLGAAPRETVMIGDKVEIDLVPAAALGMRAILCRGEFPGEWTPAVTSLVEVMALL